jgi:hypothetical protein
MPSPKIPRGNCLQCGGLIISQSPAIYCGRKCQGASKHRSLEERFWEKVNKTETCWLWTGATLGSGYGSIFVELPRRADQAHRVSWKMAFGEINPGLSVCHKCDTPLCVRPDHLFLGTAKENCADMHQKKRWRSPWISRKPALSREAVADIIANRGLSLHELARRHRVARATIKRVLAGLGPYR